MSHDSFFPPTPRCNVAGSGYWIEPGQRGQEALAPSVWCRMVHGFSDALEAALDPLGPAPPRLVIAGLDDEAEAWLEGWAEDADQVRRALVIRRAADGAQVAVIATLASHGFGVPTSLAVESVRARGDDAGDIRRSGVHLKVDVQAALARHDFELGPSWDPL